MSVGRPDLFLMVTGVRAAGTCFRFPLRNLHMGSRRPLLVTSSSATNLAQSIDNRLSVQSIRRTSAGPPPRVVKEGSLTYKYENFISRWPKALSIHNMVVDGSRWCFQDLRTYFRIRRELSSGKRTLEQLTVPELEVLVQVPDEMSRIAIVTILLPLPLTVYIVGFAVIFFPRLVLTRHFWSDVQRKEFFLGDVVKCLSNGYALREQASHASDIKPKTLKEFDYGDMATLASLHNMYPLPGVHGRISNREKGLRRLDEVINVDDLTERQLVFHLFIRRIDSTNQSSESEMRTLLKEWIRYTHNLSPVAYLAAPVFFNALHNK